MASVEALLDRLPAADDPAAVLAQLADLCTDEDAISTAIALGAGQAARDCLPAEPALRVIKLLAGPELVSCGVVPPTLAACPASAALEALERLCACDEGVAAVLGEASCYEALLRPPTSDRACDVVRLLVASGAPCPPPDAVAALAALPSAAAQAALATIRGTPQPSTLPEDLVGDMAALDRALQAAPDKRVTVRPQLGAVVAALARADAVLPALSVLQQCAVAPGLVEQHGVVEAVSAVLREHASVADVQAAGLSLLIALMRTPAAAAARERLDARACAAGAQALPQDADVVHMALLLLRAAARRSNAARSGVAEAGGFAIAASVLQLPRRTSHCFAAALDVCTELCELGDGGRSWCVRSRGVELAVEALRGFGAADAAVALAAVRLLQRLCVDARAALAPLCELGAVAVVAEHALEPHLEDANVAMKALFAVAEVTSLAEAAEALSLDALRTVCRALRHHARAASARVAQQALRVLANATLDSAPDECSVVAAEGAAAVCEALAAHSGDAATCQYGFGVLLQVVDAGFAVDSLVMHGAVPLVFAVLERETISDLTLLELAMGLLAGLAEGSRAAREQTVSPDADHTRSVCHFAAAERSTPAVVEHAMRVLAALLPHAPDAVANADAATTLVWVARTYSDDDGGAVIADEAVRLLCLMAAAGGRAATVLGRTDGAVALLTAAALAGGDDAVRALLSLIAESRGSADAVGRLRACGVVEALLARVGSLEGGLEGEVMSGLQGLM